MDGFNAGFAATTAFIAERVELVSHIGPGQSELCFASTHGHRCGRGHKWHGGSMLFVTPSGYGRVQLISGGQERIEGRADGFACGGGGGGGGDLGGGVKRWLLHPPACCPHPSYIQDALMQLYILKSFGDDLSRPIVPSLNTPDAFFPVNGVRPCRCPRRTKKKRRRCSSDRPSSSKRWLLSLASPAKSTQSKNKPSRCAPPQSTCWVSVPPSCLSSLL